MPAANIRSEEQRASHLAKRSHRSLQKIGHAPEKHRERRRNYRKPAEAARAQVNQLVSGKSPALRSIARESGRYSPSISVASEMPDTKRTIAHRTETSPRATNKAAPVEPRGASQRLPRAKAERRQDWCRSQAL